MRARGYYPYPKLGLSWLSDGFWVVFGRRGRYSFAMCGIAGFYALKNDKDSETRRHIGVAMERAIAHRGPDAADIWQDSQLPLTLAHRRLAILDLSDAGKQPMHSPSGRYVVTYNGEVYNYQELQKELEAAGHVFQSRSDTEVMLVAFEQWGVAAALQKMNGMFAMALWDRQTQKLHFMRDRFGKKPLYVGWAGSDLVFASELKSFHAHPDFTGDINPNSTALYMQYGYMHAPHCIFKNTWQMLPATRMTIDLNTIKSGADLSAMMVEYWSLAEVATKGKANISLQSEGEIIDEFEGLLSKSTAERMVSDVPLGAFLSGGIDSSTVVAMMQKNASKPVKTYSIGFEDVRFNEAEHAKAIAMHLGTDHHEFYVSGQDALDVVPNLPDIYDEPFADQSQIPTYLISKHARAHVSVALSGDGGDEILGGYDRHVKVAALWGKVGWIPRPIRQVIFGVFNLAPVEFFNLLKSGNPNFGSQVKRALSIMGLKNADDIYQDLMRAWPEGADVVMGGVVPSIPLTDKQYWPSQQETQLNFSENMIFGDTLAYRPNDLMVKTDRASMAVGLEVRAPLMDYKLAEYCWTVPHDMKIRGGQGKWLLRQLLGRHVPEVLYNRPKMGFSVPLTTWLRGDLKTWGSDLLSPERLKNQGILNADMITKRWNAFQKSDSYQDVPKDLWAALMFQSWYQKYKA